jgi:hypothetical protein
MVHRIAFAIVLGIGTAACGGKSAAPSGGTTTTTPAPAELPDPANESLGGIRLNDPQSKVVQVLGEPTTKGEVQEWEATGARVSSWQWAGKGIQFDMGEDPQAGFTVLGMTLEAPSTLTTSRGVGIGATFADVDKTYGAFRGKGVEEGETERWSEEDGIIVGSVYGGTMFSFTDGKVSSIFVGAAAE